ncbi:hypothetical protein A2U01_0103977, partial [Trifolium medium]|nr:hypothetical protein [Trifolium medium]
VNGVGGCQWIETRCVLECWQLVMGWRAVDFEMEGGEGHRGGER